MQGKKELLMQKEIYQSLYKLMLLNLKGGGKMMNKNLILILIHIYFVFIVFCIPLQAQIEVVGCFDSKHNLIPKGQSWVEIYNGVKYRCTCNGDGTTTCVQESSSSSLSSSNNSGSGDFNQQMVQSVVTPLIQGLFDWIFSSSSDNNNSSSGSNSTYISPPPTEEEIRLARERQEKWKEQVQKVQDEYSQILNEKFPGLKDKITNDLKNRVVKSEAIKTIKQLNCAANQSIEAAKIVLQGKDDFNNPEGQLENMRSLSDFTNLKLSDCPEIKYEIPEVTVSNPVGFQQMIYQTVKNKADSIGV